MPLKIVAIEQKIERQIRALSMAGLDAYSINLGVEEFGTLRGSYVYHLRNDDQYPWKDKVRQDTYKGCLLNVFPGSLCIVLPDPCTVLNEAVRVEELLYRERLRAEQEALMAALRWAENWNGFAKPEIWREGAD